MKEENIDYGRIMNEAINKLLNVFDADKSTIILPHPEGCWKPHKEMLFHFGYEIFYQLDGGCRFSFPKEEVTITPGDVIVLPPGTPHVERSFGLNGRRFRNLVFIINKNRFTTHIAESAISGQRFDKPEPVFTIDLNTEHKALYWALARLIAEPESLTGMSPYRINTRQSALKTIAVTLLEDIDKNSVEQQGHYKVNKIKAIIGWSTLNEIPTVAELGNRVGLSPSYTSWLFHEETGETLKAYINRIKIERAGSMLLTTNWTIGEIAWMCGFSDAAYFSRIFERQCGVKPYEYRSKIR